MDKIEIFKSLLEQNKEDGRLWYLLGVEYVEQNMDSEALYALSQALRFADKELKTQVFALMGRLVNSDTCEEKHVEENTIAESKEIVKTEEMPESIKEKKVIPLQVIKGRDGDSVFAVQSYFTFEDVGGLDSLKETIQMKIIKPFTNPGLFSKFKKKSGGGLLLYGPPGCGKTFIAKATAGECNAKFITVHISDILDPYLGVSERNVRDVFENARANKPAILFFDEMDAIGYNRSKSSSSLMRPVIDQFLAELDGIESSTDRMLVIGATNMPWDVDMAFKRPGRFDKMIFIPPPDLKARAAIFQLKLQDRPTEMLDIEELAKRTELYSGADIESVVEAATEYVISDIMKTELERPITMEDMRKAIVEIKPSTLEWLKTIKNYVKYANQSGIYDDVEEYLAKNKRLGI